MLLILLGVLPYTKIDGMEDSCSQPQIVEISSLVIIVVVGYVNKSCMISKRSSISILLCVFGNGRLYSSFSNWD